MKQYVASKTREGVVKVGKFIAGSWPPKKVALPVCTPIFEAASKEESEAKGRELLESDQRLILGLSVEEWYKLSVNERDKRLNKRGFAPISVDDL